MRPTGVPAPCGSTQSTQRFATAKATVAAPNSQTERRPRVVILGTGWGGNSLARELDKDLFDVRMISPSNHFLFTSFLPATTVGTLEFRAIQEPVRTIKGLSEYYQAKAVAVNTDRKTISCQDIFVGLQFEVKYDYLVIATGCKSNTFGIPGVDAREGEEVFFLKHLFHARQIRNRILECFERATNKTLSEAGDSNRFGGWDAVGCEGLDRATTPPFSPLNPTLLI
jgi:NADH dehydrogenase FAD-containing subunit